MRAIVCEALGDPCKPLGQGVLRLAEDAPEPAMKPGHVRIRVAAAGLNFPDALMIKGQYQDKPPLPFIPGNELSGVVTEVGPHVKGFASGDRVCGVITTGAFASSAVVPAAALWKVPDALPLEAAAGVPITYGTSHLALVHRARLAAGQTLLVLGASGGVGTTAVQIGVLMGARVVAVTRGADKASYLRRLGAAQVVDMGEGDPGVPLHKRLRAVAPKGVDVVYDPVGGAMLSEALKVAAWGASYLVIGFAAGAIPKVPANLLLVKNITMHGIFWGSYMQRDRRVLAAGMEEVLGWLGSGRLAVQVSHTYPLEQLPAAITTLLQRRVTGKVILTVDPDLQQHTHTHHQQGGGATLNSSSSSSRQQQGASSSGGQGSNTPPVLLGGPPVAADQQASHASNSSSRGASAGRVEQPLTGGPPVPADGRRSRL